MTAPVDLLGAVRDAARAVTARARFVGIDDARLEQLAESLAAAAAQPGIHDPTIHHLGAGADTVAFFVTLGAVNFGSGWFPALAKRPGRSGYGTIAGRLADRFRADGPLSAAALTRLSAADCAALFGQDLTNRPIAELMGLFAASLAMLGHHLIGCHGGRFTELVEAAEGRAATLVARLSVMPLFNDIQSHDGRLVPFFKRAQLTAADLALAFDGQGWGRFDDLDRLTLFADNLVPHVLRCAGVLRTDPALAARIDAGSLIAAGSPEEVELRAVALEAVERMTARLPGVTAMRLDQLLWTQGQAPEIKARPRHRCRTVFY